MGCITAGGRLKQLSAADKLALKSAVETETAGLFSPDVLKDVLEQGYDRLNKGEAFDQVLEETAMEIQRLGGIGMCREMLRVTDALGELARGQEEEIRRKVRALTRPGR